MKYGLESAFPGGVSGTQYRFDITSPHVEKSTASQRVAFLQNIVKRFPNWAFFLSVSLNMRHTIGFETCSKELGADKQHMSHHCAYFVRKWHRLIKGLVYWLRNGLEKPLGPLRYDFIRG